MRRFEDICNSGPKGDQLYYTSSMVTADEELLGSELGWRVLDAILQTVIDGWSALWDLKAEIDSMTGVWQ